MPQMASPILPFRWDLSKREQLGALADHEKAAIPDGYHDELRQVCAKILAFAGDADLAFVGRSPEHMFDYLSGSLNKVEEVGNLTLFQFSKAYHGKHWDWHTGPRDFNARERDALLGHLVELKIAPLQLTQSVRPLRFVDFVYGGGTFSTLLKTYRQLAQMQKADWHVVEQRLGFIGITDRRKNSPNTFRWQQDDRWLSIAGKVSAKNISVPWFFWDHCANIAPKVTPSHHRGRWLKPSAGSPEQSDKIRQALARAVDLYDFGSTKEERKTFSQALSATGATHQAWLRKLAHTLKYG